MSAVLPEPDDHSATDNEHQAPELVPVDGGAEMVAVPPYDEYPVDVSPKRLAEIGFQAAKTMVTGQVARTYDVIPLFVHGNALYIGASKPKTDPRTEAAVKEIRKRNPMLVRVLQKSLEADIIPQIDAHYPIGVVVSSLGDANADSISFCTKMFREAVSLGASDVHIEWLTRLHGQVKFFVQGGFTPYRTGIERGMMRAIVGRVKILAQLDTGERNLPQDGRITVSPQSPADLDDDSAESNARVNAIPNALAETDIVVRLLPGHGTIRDLESLGMPALVRERYIEAIEQPYGIVILCGPVGAGKTTLAYATLKYLRPFNLHIASAEDPVETLIPYVRQVSVDTAVGRTFDVIIAAEMRRNVHALLVGETRDGETGRAMINASLTGVPCISTTHAINAAGVFPRFFELGVTPTSLSTTMKFSLAQRLPRLLCQTCRKGPFAVPDDLAMYDAAGVGKVYERNPDGCSDCSTEGPNKGFFGRAPIFEGIRVTELIRNQIAKAASAQEIIKAAVRDGTRPMQMHGYERVFAGETSFDEIHRVTGRIDQSVWGKELTS